MSQAGAPSSRRGARLAVVASHPIQYYAPLYRELARRMGLRVYFAHRATPQDQAAAGFGVGFDWDVDLLSGYDHRFLTNVARVPRLDGFLGCDTPGIAEELAVGGFDAVLVQGWHLKSYMQAVRAARRLHLPVFVRGDSQLGAQPSVLKQVAKRIAYPTLLRVFDAALYVGERSRAYWEHYGYPRRRMFFSPHAVDATWFAERATADAGQALRRRLGIADRSAVVLFAGKLVPFKRPGDLIAAAALLNREDRSIEVLIAGDGMERAGLEAAAARTGVRVHFLGFCNQSQMPAAYAASDMLVLPSDGRETWGLVANEALACGKPVILSDAVGSSPDLAADGAGRSFPLGDVAALAIAVTELVARRPSPHAISAKSRAYSLGVAATGIEAALKALTARRPDDAL